MLAVDALTEPRVESREVTVERVFPALGQSTTAAVIMGLLSTLRIAEVWRNGDTGLPPADAEMKASDTVYGVARRNSRIR